MRLDHLLSKEHHSGPHREDRHHTPDRLTVWWLLSRSLATRPGHRPPAWYLPRLARGLLERRSGSTSWSHTLLSFEGASQLGAYLVAELGPRTGSAAVRGGPASSPNHPARPGRRVGGLRAGNLENYIASASIFAGCQVTKGTRWMPRRQEPMKDVGGCDKPREAANQALIRGCPNGETRHG